MRLRKENDHVSADRWRVFCAIELPQPTRLAVMKYVSDLRDRLCLMCVRVGVGNQAFI